MIAEAVDAVRTLVCALAAWLIVFAVVCTPFVLAVGALVGWALRATWRGLTRALRALQPHEGPRVQPEPDSPSGARTGPHDWKEAA